MPGRRKLTEAETRFTRTLDKEVFQPAMRKNIPIRKAAFDCLKRLRSQKEAES